MITKEEFFKRMRVTTWAEFGQFFKGLWRVVTWPFRKIASLFHKKS